MLDTRKEVGNFQISIKRGPAIELFHFITSQQNKLIEAREKSSFVYSRKPFVKLRD